MSRLSTEDLRHLTLARQFPGVVARGASAARPRPGPDEAIALLDQLGPVQSQVPRAPFLALAARLPGIGYPTVCALFESFQLLKTSNLRGTVHTSTRRRFEDLDVVASTTRAPALRRALRLSAVTPAEVSDEVRRFCADDWRPRDDIVAHVRAWLAERDSPSSAAALEGTLAESLVWGNSGLVRRPKDGAWEKRTDSWHRTARPLLAAAGVPDRTPTVERALPELVRDHLVAHGPVTRHDLAFFFGVGLTSVDAARAALGDELVQLSGADGERYLDLAEPPPAAAHDPGVRLLGEFDALLLGFCGANRTRFLDGEGLGQVWAKVNGLFKPCVLSDGRIVATWQTRTVRSATILEVTMLRGHRRLPQDRLGDAFGDVCRALDLTPADVRVTLATQALPLSD